MIQHIFALITGFSIAIGCGTGSEMGENNSVDNTTPVTLQAARPRPLSTPGPIPSPMLTVIPVQTFVPNPTATLTPTHYPKSTHTPTTRTTVTPVPSLIPTATLTPTPVRSIVQSEIVNSIFQNLAIKKGDTVVWTNMDDATHTATAGTNGFPVSRGWDSGLLYINEFFEYTFTTVGSFSYTCIVHPFMNATVTVTE